MKKILLSYTFVALATFTVAGTYTSNALAQNVDDVTEEVITVGTRRQARSADNTPAPVDVINADELLNQGDTDISNVLRTSVPSYNVNSQPISDAATIVRPANLRGLAPDSTLVLVNGKRRHRAAVISFLGGGISDGSQGPDISVIPAIALKQVEVLRDGAASQYGSDAIAGVINFVLRDSPNGGAVEAQWGETYEGDGGQYKIAGNIGFPLGQDGGFVNISAQLTEADATSRSVQRSDAAALIAGGNTAVADPAQIWGQPNVNDDRTIFVNAAIPLSEAAELYSFGNLSERQVEGGFFFRNPNTRGAVFARTLNNPNYVNGVALPGFENEPEDVNVRLIGDLTGTGGCGFSAAEVTSTQGNPFTYTGMNPSITTAGDPNRDQLTAVLADPNCFAFNGMFPGGFTPRFGGDLEDSSFVLGVRGDIEVGNGLSYDASISVGESDVSFFINNTINASLGPDTPLSFRPGGYVQSDTNFNLDLAYAVPVDGFASDLNIAFGYENREEEFTIRAGDPQSFQIGPLATPSMAYPGGQGFSSSSNGFGGFTTASAGKRSQKNDAFYLDLEADVTDQIVLQGAVRFEDFDSFGSTTNYKVGGLYKFNDNLSLRSTISTGFHAPTAGQANVTNITTAFSGTTLVDQGTLPLSSAAGQFIADFIVSEGGVRPTLGPEESENFTFGGAFSTGEIDWTIDFFNIAVDDRISISDQQNFVAALQTTADNNMVAYLTSDTTGQLLNKLDAAGVLNASDFAGSEDLTSFGFFNNAFDTETRGLDVVANTNLNIRPAGDSSLSLALNWTETEVTRGAIIEGNNGTLSVTRQLQLERNIPRIRGNLTFNHNEGAWRGLARLNYFGDFFECHLDAVGDDPAGSCALPVNGDSEVTIDLEGAYRVQENVEIVLGARNAFDSYPKNNPFATEVGAQYLPTAPNGFNGGSYYLKVKADF